MKSGSTKQNSSNLLKQFARKDHFTINGVRALWLQMAILISLI